MSGVPSSLVRRRLIGLPLQRSVFDELWSAADLVGLSGAFPAGRFPAHLDTAGDLHIDPVGVATLRDAFPANPDSAFLAAMEGRRVERCRELTSAVGAAHSGGVEPAAALTRLLEAVAAVMPYPVLTRIVPGLLAEAAGGPVPVPEPPSPGAILSANLRRLASWCAARGWPPAALRDAWPLVDYDVADVVRSFCRAHSGFGPVAWEAPGFDSPRYTLTAMATLVPSPTGRDGTVEWHPVTACPDSAADTVHQVAVRWIEHMDRQIWLQRRAFHHGAVPLLAALGDDNGVAPWRLLFAERSELSTGIPAAAVLDERIAAYLSGTEYLTKAGIDLNRIDVIFGGTEAWTEHVAPSPSPPPAAAVLYGTGASPGTMTGEAFVLGDDADVTGLVPGSVLVVRVLHPYLAPALARASAVVVEEGGLLQHATILAREMGIPAVVGVRDAVAMLGGAPRLHVDGTEGRVTLLPPPGDSGG